jgi:pentatricopeptide repeat protein
MPGDNKSDSCLVLLQGVYVSDQRVVRSVSALETRYSVFIASYDRLFVHASKDYKNVLTRKSISAIKRALFVVRSVWLGLSVKPKLIFANDADTLLSATLIKALCKARMVYDAHEYFQDKMYYIRYPLILRNIMILKERALLRYVDAMIVVSDSIKAQYERVYRGNIEVVRNIRKRRHVQELDEDTKQFIEEVRRLASLDVPLFLYFGNTLSRSRGLHIMRSITWEYSQNAVLIAAGRNIRNANGKSYIVDDRVLQVNFNTIDVDGIEEVSAFILYGFSLIEPDCLSYKYSLPNKLFDYLRHNIPVIVSDIPEQRRVVEKYRAGVIYNDMDESMKRVREYSRADMKKDELSREMNWENEKFKLLKTI